MTAAGPHPFARAGRLAAFARDRLERRDEDRLWLALTLFLGLLAAAAFLRMAFSAPAAGVQDDARMFLSWMSRWDDPASLRGDLMADYWQSVTPWFFTALFRAAWALGVEPLVFARILPAFLYLATALFSYRFARAIGAEPPAAFFATAALIAFFADGNAVANATPRGLWPPLVLAILDGLARLRIARTALAQLLLAGCYPQLTLVMASVIGLTLVAPRERFLLDLGTRRVLLVAACAAATVAGILPFLLDTGRFDPVVTLAEALRIPTFGPGGRNQITQADGTFSPFCGQRLGLFGNKCDGATDPRFWGLLVLVSIGPLVLLWRMRRSPVPGAGPGIRSALPFLVLGASLGWYGVAHLALFRLHLPSRYSAALVMLAIPVLVALLAEAARGPLLPSRLVKRGRAAQGLVYGGTALLLALAVLGASRADRLVKRPADPALIAAIRALPRDAVVAGFVRDLDFSPVLTNRSTLFSRELTIGYQLGYLQPMLRRMEDMRDAVLTHDPAVLAERLRRNRVDLFLVPAGVLEKPEVPADFRGFFVAGDLARREREAAQGGPTALAAAAARCDPARYRLTLPVWNAPPVVTTTLAFDARCLEAGAAP